ncbi:MAG: penicillin-binding protein activator [Gammaproteobacteria bacterium]|nr:penicillin-binding protein activator [Gammaproteobacteria bacterium]
MPASKPCCRGCAAWPRTSASCRSRIALILPFSSAYSEAARIIRDGFMAGWYQDGSDRPEIRIYDAGQENIVSIYNQAVTDGAQMIVGPLQKGAVNTLVNQGLITVPTLTLNYYEGDTGRYPGNQ